MPSIQSFFQKQPANRASTPSLVHTPPGPTSSSSRPNNSVPAQGPAQYGRPTISTQAGPAATISLVPPGPPSTLPSPLTPSPGSRGGEFAAEHQNQRGLHPSNGGGSNTDLSDNPTFNPSSSSSAASASSARRGGEINPQPQPSNRKPVGIGFFSRPTSSVVAPPASPQPGSSGGGGSGGSLSRRISTRHTKQQPSSEPQSYHQQPPHDTEGLDPYLQQQPPGRSTRPQSVLPSPRESEAIDYAVNRGGEFQRHNSFSQPSLASQQQQQQQQQQQPHQPQYYEQGQEYQQQQQKQQQEYQTQHLQQPQQQQQEGHMSPGPRPSVDVMRQPPSRDASTLSQLHQQQQYAQQQRTNSNESYQNQGGQPGGQQNQTYDPSKYDEQGRATPEVRSQSRAGDVQTQESLGLQQALQELETLQNKYRKVKALYFDRSAEIERLQNTLAHQRLAQSRTSLDDNEYTSRFERLDGAIKNVAFEIRQSWKSIPNWLTNVINAGAAAKGGREMTVVGRATISRWVVDEILEQFFHPALDTMLSIQLKEIERNIRLLAPAPQTVEDDDALSTKVCNWRLTTLDALQGLINSPQALDTRTRLAEELVHRLVEYLRLHLQEPYPPGLLGGVQMVVDIAIGLASNLPVESRDVRVWYPLPGCRFDAKFMKGEGGLPPLGTPASSLPEPEKMQTDNNSNNSGDNAADEGPQAPPKDGVGNPSTRAGVAGLPGQQKQDTKKSSGFSGRVKKALHGAGAGTQAAAPQPPPSPGAPPQGQGVNVSKQQQQGSQVSLPVGQEGKGDVEKIRVAGFMAVEVRGRSILVKAPVWL